MLQMRIILTRPMKTAENCFCLEKKFPTKIEGSVDIQTILRLLHTEIYYLKGEQYHFVMFKKVTVLKRL